MTAEKTLEYVAGRRKELRDQHADAAAKLQQAKDELAALEREEKALVTLERALKPESVGRMPPAELRRSIIESVTSSPAGLSASEIIDMLAARGNKVRQDAIRNALHAMKKPRAGKPPELLHNNGRYFVPTSKTDEAPATQAVQAAQQVR